MQRNSRKEGPDVWQFRWSETRLDGKRLYRKKIVGTVEQYPDEHAARRSVVGLVAEINTDDRFVNSDAMTVGQLLAQSRNEENLSSVLDPLDSSSLAEIRTCRG
jgi:hypothetical protein